MRSNAFREEALDWLEEAKVDLQRAIRSYSEGDYSLSCYMSQQAIEKAFRALIIGFEHKSPPHIHDLTILYNQVRDIMQLPENIVERLPEVSQYYVTARYPNAGIRRPSKSFSRLQAKNALEVAKHVIRKVEEAFHPGESC